MKLCFSLIIIWLLLFTGGSHWQQCVLWKRQESEGTRESAIQNDTEYWSCIGSHRCRGKSHCLKGCFQIAKFSILHFSTFICKISHSEWNKGGAKLLLSIEIAFSTISTCISRLFLIKMLLNILHVSVNTYVMSVGACGLADQCWAHKQKVVCSSLL